MWIDLVLVSGAALVSTAFIFRRKENYYRDFFDQVEKSQKYHLDYVESLSKLPLNKNLMLFGVPKSDNSNEQILSRSIIKRSKDTGDKRQSDGKEKQFDNPSEDRLWKLSLKNDFYVQTLSDEKIYIRSNPETQLYAFNLLRRNQNSEVEERVIVKNQPICAFGKLQKRGQGEIVLLTQLIMGTKHQNFLSYMSSEMSRINQRNKFLTIAGTLCFGVHFTYRLSTKQQIVRKQSVTEEIMAEMQQKK